MVPEGFEKIEIAHAKTETFQTLTCAHSIRLREHPVFQKTTTSRATFLCNIATILYLTSVVSEHHAVVVPEVVVVQHDGIIGL